MKNKRRQRYTMPGKTAAFILLVIGTFFAAAGVCVTCFMIKEGFYVMDPQLTGACILEKYGLQATTGIESWVIDYSEMLEIWMPVTALCGLTAAIGSFVYLMCAAGWKQGADKVTAGVFGKVPTDVFVIVTALLAIGWKGYVGYHPQIRRCPEMITIFPVWFLLAVQFLISISARIKAGNLWTNTVIYYIWGWIKKAVRLAADILRQLPLIWKGVSGIALLSFVQLCAMGLLVHNTDILKRLLLFWFLEKMLLVPFLCIILLQLKKLQEAGQKLAEGNLDYKVSTADLFGDIKAHAEMLNCISEGVTKAVNERMKSERFKTELITNVSHDIKTPLTSIINYSDLLNKEETDNEKIREYSDVLYRQSTRLKKLIEDLVEASKASTGSIEVNLTPCEVGVLLEQTIGEFEQRLYERDIDIICKQPQTPVKIMADGRHLWRVFDNLMNNICKYAQSGTRVYLNVEADEKQVTIVFKNISGYPLDISAEELMERFVRGDRSRHTEGNGLGLSIAKSLVELQNGSLELFIDGDLFKVLITFPVIT